MSKQNNNQFNNHFNNHNIQNINNMELVNDFIESIVYLNEHRPDIKYEYLSNPNDERLYNVVTERNRKRCESFLEDQRNEEFKKHFLNVKANIRNFEFLITGTSSILSESFDSYDGLYAFSLDPIRDYIRNDINEVVFIAIEILHNNVEGNVVDQSPEMM
jgi:hypothetical protein